MMGAWIAIIGLLRRDWLLAGRGAVQTAFSLYNEAMRIKILTLSLTLMALFSLAALARAHGGGTPQLVNEPLGPYWLSAWTYPDPPQVGELQVTAALAKSDTGEPVTEPVITVYVRGASKSDVFEKVMTRDDAATPYFYNADVDVPYAGTWMVELVVREGDWEGRASFPLTIQPAPINENLIRLAAFLTLAFLFTGWWFWGRKPRKKRVRKRIFMPRPDEDSAVNDMFRK
ncbi:MAG TPA: hypothetical protein EYP25_01850 [Anaerolineae bacterium]|nr:hypothetical protein [Anaerolineae bacterium]